MEVIIPQISKYPPKYPLLQMRNELLPFCLVALLPCCPVALLPEAKLLPAPPLLHLRNDKQMKQGKQGRTAKAREAREARAHRTSSFKCTSQNKNKCTSTNKNTSSFSKCTSPNKNKCTSQNNNTGKGRSEIKFNENTNNSTTPLYQKCGGAGHNPYSRSLLKSSPIITKREFHHKVKAKNRIGPHNIDTLSIILGSLLGNGKMQKLVEGSMLVVRVTNKEYALWLYRFFYNRGYTSNLQPRQNTRTILSTEGTEYYGYEFNTFTFRSFNWIHRMFYNNGRKVIPGNIYEYLTPLALAVWIMDD